MTGFTNERCGLCGWTLDRCCCEWGETTPAYWHNAPGGDEKYGAFLDTPCGPGCEVCGIPPTEESVEIDYQDYLDGRD